MEGQIVRSLRGHDVGRLYWVAEAEGDFLLLADGKHHRLAKPKRKRRKHVEPMGNTLEQPPGDARLRKALAIYRDEGGNHAWQKMI